MAFVLLGTANALGETYTLVTSAPADWSGDYLIVSGTSALSGGTSSWGTFETVTVSGNDITTTSNIAVTISPGGTSGSYYIYQNSNSTYLAEVTSNTFSAVATASTSTEWVISLNSGNAQIACHSTSTRLLRLNGTSGFRCYTTATGTLPKLYKKQVASCTAATTSWTSSSVTKVTTDANFTNTFTTDNTGAKTFASSNTAVATVNATTGEVDVLTAGTTTISVTQPETSGICAVNTSYSLTVNAPSYTITASTNNASYGTVSKSGSVITGSPAPGYGYASPAYTVTSGTATVSQSGNDFTVAPSSDCAVRINFEALPTYTLSLSNDGSTYTAGVFPLTTYAGNSTTLPTLSDCSGYTFVGWDTNSATTSAPTYAPGATYTTTAANVTLYAVYSKTTGGGSTNVTFNVADIAAAESWVSGTQYLSYTISPITITYAGGANDGKYYSSDATWRSYSSGGGTVTITSSGGDISAVASNPSQTFTVQGDKSWKFTASSNTSFKSFVITYGSSTTTYTTLPGCCTAPSTALSLSATSPLTLSGANVSTAITVTGGNGGTVNYTVDPSSTGSMSGNTFTATATGTYTITGTQALNGSTCGGSDDVTIVVNPAVTYSVSSTLTGCAVAPALPATVDPSTPGIMVTVTPNSCYTLPASISVTMGGTPLTLNTDYLWATSGADNLLIQPTGGFSGNIVITITATQPQYAITYSTGLAGWTPTQANVACGGSFTAATPAEGLFVCADGSAFAGWSTNASATSVEYAVGATINPVANMTLYGVWSEGTVSNNYTKITNTSQLEAGADYLVVYTASNVAMKAATYSTGLDKSSVTISSNTITTSDAALIWRLGGTSNAWTLYNASTSKYLSLPSGSVTTLLALADTGTPFTISTTSITSNDNTGTYKYVSYHTGSSFFNNYSSNYAVLFKRQASVTYSTTATCTLACADAAVVTLTPTASSINMPASGNATTTIAFSQSGGGAGTWGTPSVTRLSGTGTATVTKNGTNIDFSTTGVGEYEVSIAYTETCAKVGKTTITVLATPVVTIVDVTPLTFTANCGEASAAQSVSVSGYNLTANMIATAPTNFLVSNALAGTYAATATFTQTGGVASGTLFIKANPPAGSANPISGNVTLTSTDATTRTLAVSATVSCTPVHVYFNDKGNVVADSTEYVGGTITFPANPSCTDANYTFDGWYTTTLNDAASYTKVTAPYTVTGETTLYAVYRKLTTGGGSSTYTGTVGSAIWNATASNAGTLNSVSWQAAGSGGNYAGYDATKGHQFGSGANPFTSLSLTATSFTGSISQVEVSTSGASGITGTVSVSVGGTTYSPATATLTDANTAYTFTGSSTGNVVISWTNTSAKAMYLKTIKVTYSVDVYKYTTNPLCCPNQLATPANFAATAGDTQVGLTWDAVANASSYNIECVTNPAKNVTGVVSTSTTVTGLTNCTTYSFKITAMGDNTTYCQSNASAAITSTPQSAVLTATFNAGTNGTCGTASLTNTCLSNNITLPSATPNVGFAFDGWQVDGTGTVYLGGSTFTLSANVTLVAKYRVLATYAISFINEGVEVDSLVQIVTEGSAAAVESRTMLSSCSEYLFKGWSTTQISGTSMTAPTYYNFATAVTGPVTLYAVYSFVDTSNGGSNEYTLVTNKTDLTAGSKVIIGSGAYVMGGQNSNNRAGLTTGASTWTKAGSTITIPTGSTAAILTVGVDGSNYTFSDGVGYLYAASSSKNYLRTQSTLDNNCKWALGTVDGGTGQCASVVAQGTNTNKTMALNGSLFSCYSAQGSYGKMYFYKNTAAAEYTTNPICSPMIVVDQTDVENSIDSTNFVIGLGGTATSAGHTVFSKNCTSASYVQPVIFGVDKAVFSVNWTRVYLDNGAMDTVYTVSYSPVIGTSHKAFLYFETNDHTVISDTIPLYGEVCTAVVFGSHSATENTITINWTAPSAGSSLRVWNTITVPNACTSAPQPFDQTYVLGTETTKTVTGLKASGTYYYQATSGTCISEQRTIVTPAASGVPALTASSSTIEFICEIGKDTTQSVSLSGVYMNNASVSVAITGAGAAAFTTNASITLDATGKGTLNVTYHPTSSQTFVAVATITYTSGCETKTVVVNLVGNVPGIDMVEINGDATGFVIHTDFQGTPDIVLSQEVEHAGTGKVANDLFFSKYYEASGQVKLVGIYNGTTDSIPLKNIRIVQKKAYKATDPDVIKVNPTKFRTWSTATAAEVVAFTNAFWTNYKIPPRTEMILFTSVNDASTMNCVRDGIGFNHDYWFPVGANAATYTTKPNYFGSSSLSFGGDKSVALQRQRANNSWEFIDLIGAGDSIIANGDSTQTITANSLNDDPGWYCPDGVNYKTKEAAPLSTNRHLLIRKNTVVDGLTAVAQNTLDMETLCSEWEGLNVPKSTDNAVEVATSCEHFSAVAEFNYDGYYSSFERVNEDLVTFTPAGATAPGDWVGTFANPTTTFQDTLRCYNLQISVLRYYDMRTPATPVELTKAEVQGYQTDALLGDPTAQAIIAALDTVEAASTQWRVPIIVKNSATVYTDDVNLFRDLSVDTCRTCDVVILNGGTLIKTTKTVNDRDSVRSVIVYNGGRLIVPDGLDYVVNDLQVRAKGDSVGAAFIEGNLMMKNPRVVHDKRVENDKPYFFTLPYDCPISKITQMNGKTMGPYGATWVIKYYDGAQRIQNRGLSNNWKVMDAGATLKAGVGYVLYISSDIYKYVRFPMVANATFTEKNTGKSMDVTQYGHAQAYGTNGTDGTLGWNNVGWNLVGNPYVSYFMAQGAADSIMTGTTILKGRYLPNGGYNENTWKLDDTENVYITVPDAVADGGYLQKRVSLTQLDPFISFFVQADRTGSLNFATSSREQVAKVMRAPVVDYNEVVLNFDVAGKSDRTTIILDKERNTSYEIGQDLLKWKGKWGKTPYLYSFDNANNPLAFNAINYDEAKGSVPVAFYMPTSYARYTFSIDRSASKLQNIEHVYLLRNGSVIADLLTTNYTATDLKLKAENKEFAISIQRAAEVVTPVNPTEDDALMPRAITERHEVRVEQLPAEGTVMVMDAVGRTIATRTLTGADNITFELPVDGVYTITVMTPARNYTLKTVIR